MAGQSSYPRVQRDLVSIEYIHRWLRGERTLRQRHISRDRQLSALLTEHHAVGMQYRRPLQRRTHWRA